MSLLGPVYTDLLAKSLALVMQKWLENFAKEWVEYPFFAMPANTNNIANVRCERTLMMQHHFHESFCHRIPKLTMIALFTV